MNDPILADGLLDWLFNGYLFAKVLIGFSIIVFVHELGHFLAAKWMGVRVDRFAIGFFYRLCGYRKGEGLTFGPRPAYSPEELAEKGYGETDYCLNALPFGGYVKMLGEDDIQIDEKTGEVTPSTDPRAFTNKSIGRRMVVVSAGVICNVLFAILVYAAVFLFAGREVPAPVIGFVDPESPAAAAGLRMGDRIVAMDDGPVGSLEDVAINAMLASKPMRLTIERNGKRLDREILVDLAAAGGGRTPIGILPMATTRLASSVADSPDRDGFEPGDVVTHVNGEKVTSAHAILVAVERCGGKPLTLTVERPDPDNPDKPQVLESRQEPRLYVEAPTADDPDTGQPLRHILGLLRCWRVGFTEEGWPAEAAGFKPGDVIVQWGSVLNPRYDEITAAIKASDGNPIDVVVERDGARVDLSVTPRRKFSLLGDGELMVGIAFEPAERRPIVADVVAGTPAAELGMPRGAEIVSIDGRAVHNWADVVEGLKAAAGRDCEIVYRSGGAEMTGQMPVPSSIVNEMGLPPGALLRSINGQDTVAVGPGKSASLPSTLAVRKLLEANIGQTVEVEYYPSRIDTRRVKGTFTVRPDNVDPWQMRCVYQFALSGYFETATTRLSAGGNPLRAVAMASRQTVRDLWGIYRIVTNMLSPKGRVKVSDVSGPVGIVVHAVKQAETGLDQLLWFLAYISVNLAVINFLPLPVVDGGLMMFLLLEKLRGRPLNVKVQVWTTLAGLVLIVLCFVLVTFQDIAKWLGGGM